jgi:hypothetical protein
MVILGGTNDLNQNRDADTIFEYLMKAWDFALSRGTQVLALTVPEVSTDDSLIKTTQCPNIFKYMIVNAFFTS